ncbi:MAG: hypothetical protein EA390_04825 [Balneolaceae bacterium]|nr:MAG: hypothetical protein EA390_04825 [Balneolaceae bacterium]
MGGGHRTPGGAQGCLTTRLQRLDPGCFFVFARNQKLSGKPTPKVLKMISPGLQPGVWWRSQRAPRRDFDQRSDIIEG